MHKDERDLLDVLKAELAFLEKGGYGCSPRESWRQPLIFQDSPSCMNYDSKENPGPCSDCVLMQLVPVEFRGTQIPCRHIPLNTAGETLESIGQYSHQFELEQEFGNWLRTTIAGLEQGRKESPNEVKRPSTISSAGGTGKALSHKLHPKCANPACPTEFRWLAGGKFFRFRPESVASPSYGKNAPSLLGIAGVEHYWLCEHCSHVFALAFEEGQGVVLKLILPELVPDESPTRLMAR